MIVQYTGIRRINGPLIVLSGVENVAYDELVEIHLNDGTVRMGNVVDIEGGTAVVQVFEGTRGMSLGSSTNTFLGHPMELGLSEEILGRVFDGAGRPADGLGPVYSEVKCDVNGLPINPISRKYPRNYIQTGISSIDGLITLIRGQKLPVFSGNGMPHDKLAAQIVKQAGLVNKNEKFAVVFAAIGVKHEVAEFFRNSFADSGVLNRVVMYLNLTNDPAVERIFTPRCALTAAEYLAFEKNYHVLVILTDMTAYCEALREISSSRGEIPSRKGYPGYLYSDLASLYERAGMLKDRPGSVTQIPILTMPNDDINHPIPDLTGYITEGQIVMDRALNQKGVYPPVSILPSLSRLMKDGIGEGYTREDHSAVANQLFSAYSKVQEIRALASVIGEEDLSAEDRRYMDFGREFEERFLSQSYDENRSITETLDLGWKLLAILGADQLDRIDPELIQKYGKI
ncbi:MAG: V-type ATP synthase subunit B [Clostridiales bacterium]|uniref:V-type ATP synthase beta chain n=1 Tax=Candidatus Egerieisoma faecipullorum TaxID=2840963 RepID=A0A9D1L947_9CLOT|nr:MAG: V-type ATP synthase subunit B [Clostridiales bacterium]HIU29574.1 V-type ATP synthase subunit B [Candidatus Egerieisoma faecipullorum]